MISSINLNLNKVSFAGKNTLKTDKEEESSSKKQQESHYDHFRELMALREEITRVENHISKTTHTNPKADISLLYKELGRMINHQIELENLIQKNISEKLEKNGL